MRVVLVLGWLWGLLFGALLAAPIFQLAGLPGWATVLICTAIGRHATRYDFEEDLFYTYRVSMLTLLLLAIGISAIATILKVMGS